MALMILLTPLLKQNMNAQGPFQTLFLPFTIQTVILLAAVGLLLVVFKRYVNGPHYPIPAVSLRGKVAIVTGGNAGIGF
jgi:membrane protein implicated in regulation of membrane protease activity